MFNRYLLLNISKTSALHSPTNKLLLLLFSPLINSTLVILVLQTKILELCLSYLSHAPDSVYQQILPIFHFKCIQSDHTALSPLLTPCLKPQSSYSCITVITCKLVSLLLPLPLEGYCLHSHRSENAKM